MSESKEAPKATATVTPIGQRPAPLAAKPAGQTGLAQVQQPKQQPKTAGQRLDELERAMTSVFQALDHMGRESQTIKEAIRLLGNKVDALAKANIAGEAPTDETLSKIMIDTNVEELKGKVEGLVKAQVLVSTDIVGETAFIVGRELASGDNTVVNPRLQFTLGALAKEVGEKLKGHLVGDIITIKEGEVRFEIMEVYNIQEPPAPAPTAPAADATAPATASQDAAAPTTGTPDAPAAAPTPAPAPAATAAPTAPTTDASAPAAAPAAQDQSAQTPAATASN
jgi:hypothetical protein